MFAFERCAASGPVEAPSSAWAMTGSLPANASGPLKPIGAAARWSRKRFAYQKSWAVENARLFVMLPGGDHEQRAPPQNASWGIVSHTESVPSWPVRGTSSAATGPLIVYVDPVLTALMWSVRSETAWTYSPLRVVAVAPSQLAGTSDTTPVPPSARGLTSKCRIFAADRDAVHAPDQLPGPRVDDRVVERLRPLRREHAPAEPVLVAVAEPDERRLAAVEEPRPPVGAAARGRGRCGRAAGRRGLERLPRPDRRRGASRRPARRAGRRSR